MAAVARCFPADERGAGAPARQIRSAAAMRTRTIRVRVRLIAYESSHPFSRFRRSVRLKTGGTARQSSKPHSTHSQLMFWPPAPGPASANRPVWGNEAGGGTGVEVCAWLGAAVDVGRLVGTLVGALGAAVAVLVGAGV